ncbi:hypothetical protein SK128_019000 [Halocaridina rubra]|uniref:Tudor domain-containing protein n=1 Tax=Halocaridina rubra TaxID=373956 RepID=A0AAN8X0X8_HALRR
MDLVPKQPTPKQLHRKDPWMELLHQYIMPIVLPTCGTVLEGIVTKVYSLSHFYVYFYQGLQDIRERQSEMVLTDPLSPLTEAMFDYYENTSMTCGNNSALDSKLQVVREICKQSVQYCRVLVLDTKEEKEKHFVKLFFVDHGEQMWYAREHLRPIHPKFLDLPPQAIPCRLHGLEKPVTSWSRQLTDNFNKMTEEIPLAVQVMEVDSAKCVLSVILYNTNEENDININEEMKISILSNPPFPVGTESTCLDCGVGTTHPF